MDGGADLLTRSFYPIPDLLSEMKGKQANTNDFEASTGDGHGDGAGDGGDGDGGGDHDDNSSISESDHDDNSSISESDHGDNSSISESDHGNDDGNRGWLEVGEGDEAQAQALYARFEHETKNSFIDTLQTILGDLKCQGPVARGEFAPGEDTRLFADAVLAASVVEVALAMDRRGTPGQLRSDVTEQAARDIVGHMCDKAAYKQYGFDRQFLYAQLTHGLRLDSGDSGAGSDA
jgi:hypothetical protein